MTAEPLVQGTALRKQFGEVGWLRRDRPVQAVSDVTIGVGRGEALGLVGESGSGKSTVGRLLLGLMSLTSGKVVFDGTPMATDGKSVPRSLRRRMQLVFQDPYGSLDPRRRVGSQIQDTMRIHELVPRQKRPGRVRELLSQVGLPPEHADRFPHEFSGGQRQRIAIARALASGPEFLVADEPVSALDVSVQGQVVRLLADLRTRLGLAMLFISHDLPVVRHLCDRVAVMYLGRIMEEGPVEAIFARPHHPYTQALLSAAPSMHPERRGKRIILKGDPPSPADPPSGCVFRTRCPIASPRCAAEVPTLREREPGHKSACSRDLA